MSIEAPHTTGLFAELLEGANALAQRPTLIAERDQAKVEAQANADRAQRITEAYDTANNTITDLNSRLAKLEADLAQATFREKEVGDKLSLVASVLKDVMGNATAAMELVEPPKPEPKPEPVSVQEDPTQTTSSQNDGSTTTNSTNQDGGQSAPVDLPGQYPWHQHIEPMDVASDTTKIAEAERGYQKESDDFHGMTPKGQSAVGPTASSTEEQSPPVQPATTPSSVPTPVENATSASSPKPYWEKPKDEEWFSWAKAGNDVAPWVTFNWYEKQALDALKSA